MPFDINIVECRYFSKYYIRHCDYRGGNLTWLWTRNRQPHSSSYGVFVVRILEKLDRVKTASHCIPPSDDGKYRCVNSKNPWSPYLLLHRMSSLLWRHIHIKMRPWMVLTIFKEIRHLFDICAFPYKQQAHWFALLFVTVFTTPFEMQMCVAWCIPCRQKQNEHLLIATGIQ